MLNLTKVEMTGDMIIRVLVKLSGLGIISDFLVLANLLLESLISKVLNIPPISKRKGPNTPITLEYCYV